MKPTVTYQSAFSGVYMYQRSTFHILMLLEGRARAHATHLEHHGTQHGPHFSSCALQLVDRVKLFVQTVQANGFSPVCVRLCSVRPLDVVQRALQPT